MANTRDASDGGLRPSPEGGGPVSEPAARSSSGPSSGPSGGATGSERWLKRVLGDGGPGGRGPLLRWLATGVRLLVAVVIIGAGVQAAVLLSGLREEPARVSHDAALVRVQAVRLAEVEAPRAFVGYGTARAKLAASVAAQVGGRVIERPGSTEAGRSVSEGDVLVRLDPSDFEARARATRGRIAAILAELSQLLVEEESLGRQVSAAEAETATARRDLGRAQTIRERTGAGEAEVDARRAAVARAERAELGLSQQLGLIPGRRASAEARLEAERAQLRRDELDLERATIRAPFDGVLQRVEVETGDYVSPGGVVARVVAPEPVEVPLSVPASASGLVSVGDMVELRASGREAVGSEPWLGVVSRVAPEVDEQSRTLLVFVERAEGAASWPRPGRFVQGRVRAGVASRLVVPRSAVVENDVLIAELATRATENIREERGDPDLLVYRVRRTPVSVLFTFEGSFPEVSARERQWVVIENAAAEGALETGSWVITTNLDTLEEGALVEVNAGDPPAEGGR